MSDCRFGEPVLQLLSSKASYASIRTFQWPNRVLCRVRQAFVASDYDEFAVMRVSAITLKAWSSARVSENNFLKLNFRKGIFGDEFSEGL